MSRPAILRVAVFLLVLLLAAGCENGYVSSGGGETGSPGSPPEKTSDGTGPVREKTTTAAGTTGGPPNEVPGEVPSGVPLVEISSGPDGLNEPQVVLAQSAAALSGATGIRAQNSGEGTYLAVFWGEKPTGGYTVEVLSARPEGSRVVVRLALEEPPPDALVGQALTYPYAAAVLRGVDTGEKEFVFVTENGRELGWPVRNV